MRRAVSIVLAVGVVAACHGGPDPATGPGATPAHVGTCNPSTPWRSDGKVTTTCPSRVLPPSNASSARGCKSDADCKDGIEGRCVDSGYKDPSGSSSRVTPSNLLAGPPPLPAPTLCTYDQCVADADCGAKARCACGAGSARNACVGVDACFTDHDCAPESLCRCGASGSPNVCALGNCRTDGDCAGGPCIAGVSGSYCATAHDACHAQADCKASPGTYQECDYDRASKAWACRVVPPRLPG